MSKKEFGLFLLKTIIVLLPLTPIVSNLVSAYIHYSLSGDWEAIWLTWSDDPTSSIVINWRWTHSGEAYVIYWNTTHRRIINISAEELNHVYIGGLSPNTTYNYVVGYYEHGKMVNWSAVHSFQTLPTTGTVKVMVLSDTHAPGYGALDRVLDAINNVSGINFMVHCGDIVDRSFPQFWADFFTKFHKILSEVPIMPSIGNHEIHYGDPLLFSKFFELPNNELWYYYRAGDAVFISLYVADSRNFIFPEEEYEMLIDAINMAKAQGLWTIVYFHIPPIEVMPVISYPEIARKLTEIMEVAKPDLIITGHYHVYIRTEFVGSKLILMGASGGFPNQVVYKEKYEACSFKLGYGILEISKDTLHFKYISIDGKIVDEFEIKRSS